MTERKNGSEQDTQGTRKSKSNAADALEDLRRRVFGANPGRGAVKKATDAAGADHNPVQRAISPNSIEAIRKVEAWLDEE